MREIIKTDKRPWEYICNRCYKYRGECGCKSSYLGLDPGIIKSVQILHDKNYQTVSCCEGHIITYKTDKGVIYTKLSQGYITLDSHSYPDILKEIEKGFSFEVTAVDLKANRYNILLPEKKLVSNRYEYIESIKASQIKELEEELKRFNARSIKEPIIITNY